MHRIGKAAREIIAALALEIATLRDLVEGGLAKGAHDALGVVVAGGEIGMGGNDRVHALQDFARSLKIYSPCHNGLSPLHAAKH